VPSPFGGALAAGLCFPFLCQRSEEIFRWDAVSRLSKCLLGELLPLYFITFPFLFPYLLDRSLMMVPAEKSAFFYLPGQRLPLLGSRTSLVPSEFSPRGSCAATGIAWNRTEKLSDNKQKCDRFTSAKRTSTVSARRSAPFLNSSGPYPFCTPPFFSFFQRRVRRRLLLKWFGGPFFHRFPHLLPNFLLPSLAIPLSSLLRYVKTIATPSLPLCVLSAPVPSLELTGTRRFVLIFPFRSTRR